MGFFDRLFRRRAERGNDLQEAGLKIIRDEVLDERIENIKRILGRLSEEDLMKLDDEVSWLDMLHDISAGPWGRSGDSERYYKAYVSMRKLVSYYRFMAENMDQRERREFADATVGPWIRMLVQASFKDKDVSPNLPIAIHTQPPITVRGTEEYRPSPRPEKEGGEG